MADLSPFLSKPGEWIEELARLRADREKIEAREKALRDKLKLHMAEKSLSVVDGSTHVAKIETRESVDWTKKTLVDVFGPEWFLTTEAKLPRKSVEMLVIREVKAEESVKTDKTAEVEEFFGAAQPKAADFFDKKKRKEAK